MHAMRARAITRLVALSAIAVSSAGLAVAVATLAACQAAANLDVRYADAGSAPEAGSAGSVAPEAGGTVADAGEGGALSRVLSGCPCDPTLGAGCCMPAHGAPFCTTDTTVCRNDMGMHLRCVRPDPTSESNCCWHGSGAVAETALAAVCDGGPAACTADSDCAGTGEATCAMALCFSGTIAIGACGSVPPTCPQP